MANINTPAKVTSESNFPAQAGIASSAAAFAALALAATRAAGLELDEAGLSRLARRGSGSACRSIPAGFVEWQMGSSDANSYAASFALLTIGNWSIASPLFPAMPRPPALPRVKPYPAPARCKPSVCQMPPGGWSFAGMPFFSVIFAALAGIVELDSNMLHAVMMTSNPALFYWQAATFNRNAGCAGGPYQRSASLLHH